MSFVLATVCSCSDSPPSGPSSGGSTTGGASSGGSTAMGGSMGGVSIAGSFNSTGGSAAGGMPATAGSPAMGGAPSFGGTVGTGGATAGTGGTMSGTGGAATTGGAKATGGGPGVGGAGGSPAMGGKAGSSGSTSTGGSGGSTPGMCQKGQTKAAEVVIMGESFYAIAPQYIQNRIQDNARKAGSLGANDKYRNVAVSGQNMNYIATTEWTAATQGGATTKFVIMDGGGIDCLGGGCPNCASTFKTLLDKMATAGVQDVIYTRYPEPGNPPGSNASLKACLDSTMPTMQTTCAGSTAPRCHWVDLRPVWVNGDTTDGLHPTQSGGDHVGDLLWSEMVKLCFAQ